MAATGGKSLAGDFKGQFAGLKQQVEELRLDMGAALTEFSEAVAHGKEAVKELRTEAAEMRAAFAPSTNGPPEEGAQG